MFALYFGNRRAVTVPPVVTPPPLDKFWPLSGEGRRDRRRRLEDEAYEEKLRRQAERLVAKAVGEGRTEALLDNRKSLRQLLLTSPILKQPEPPDFDAMFAEIQQELVRKLILIREAEDEEEAALLLLS